jgi:hypothetical protein
MRRAGDSVFHDGRWRSPEGIESRRTADRLRHQRQVRMSAGGLQFHVGYAPTVADAERIRQQIKEEAPK